MTQISQLPEMIRDRMEPEPYSGCWLWIGRVSEFGYGVMVFAERRRRVTRVLYEMFIGGIEQGWEVHHKCRTPACINPSHFECLNSVDHHAQHLPTHCVNGHEFTPENTRLRKGDGLRECKACAQKRGIQHRLAHMAL